MARDRLPELLQRSTSVSSSTASSISASASASASILIANGAPYMDNSSLANTNNLNSNTNNSNCHSNKKNGGSSDSNMTQHANVNAILNPYSEIRMHLGQISSNLDTMQRMTQTINLRNFNEKEMDELRNQNLKLGNLLINKFREFKANLPKENDYNLEARMKRTLFHGLYQNYINIWQRNEEYLQYYERKLKKNLQMHSNIINCNATDEEIEVFIANKRTNLFVGNILEDTENERKNLRNLLDRYNELKKLEKSIEDVNALFLRIQSLVMEQSETIQRVEFHAQQATLYVDRGHDELQQAEKHSKSARKKKIMLIGIIVMVLIVLIFIGVFL